MQKQPNRTFCGKCGKHEAGGSGQGRQYRCPRCSAFRLAALLTRDTKPARHA